jgi:hypothetical protein
LSAEQTELANRYAFALFRLRALPLSTVTLEYDKKYGVDAFYNGVHIRNRTLRDWAVAPDLNAFADWATWSEAEDFLLPPARRLGVPVGSEPDRGVAVEAAWRRLVVATQRLLARRPYRSRPHPP